MTTKNTASTSELTLESMRADIARILHEDPDEVGDTDSLIDLGLDSIRAMALVTRWRAMGADMEFPELAEDPSLAHWWRVAERGLARRANGSEQGPA